MITIGAATGDPDARVKTAERLVALFDYVASDYAGAVENGRIVSQFEYDEQLRLVEDMRRYAGELGAPPRARLDELEKALLEKAAAPLVADRCAAMRRDVVVAFDVAVAPAAPPDRERAADLYRSRCAECHALDGGGEGERAKMLKPPPANLLDPDRMGGVTPYRAYCAITYGIEGTGMFGHMLPAADRWSLAFYSVGMRHGAGKASPDAGASAETGKGPAVPKFGLATLANETDEGLSQLLKPWVEDEAQREREVARLRAVAPFEAEAGETPIALARRLISEAREAAARGDAKEADRLVLDGYIRGIEEVESLVVARDAVAGQALVADLEGAVAALRASILKGAGDVNARAARLMALLDRAESMNDRSRLGPTMLATAAALLILREGLEAALVVAAVLAVVRRTGAKRGARAVHTGWTLALVAGIATFVLARTVISSLVLEREVVEGAVSVLAAVVLFFTSFWLISKADAQRWLAFLKRRAAGSAGAGAFFGLGSVAFLAVYREAFETVLFFEALAGGDRTRLPALLGGVGVGAVALTVAVFLILRVERRLPIAPFFALSGAALSGLAVILLGHGVHALQQTRLLVPRPIDFPRIAALGVYPDALSLAAQGALVALIAVASVVVLTRRAKAEPPAAAPAS